MLKLERFAAALGWGELREHCHTVEDQRPWTVRWYLAGDVDSPRTYCALQINEHPIGSSETYAAAVYGIRFRIFSGWHVFACATVTEALAEADRLGAWLSREWFTTLERRRDYRGAHPECSGFTWRKLTEFGAPYNVDSTAGRARAALKDG